MAKVIKFPGAEIHSDSTIDVLAEAVRIEWDTLCVVGVSQTGDIYLMCSDPNQERAVWLLEQGKMYLFGQLDE